MQLIVTPQRRRKQCGSPQWRSQGDRTHLNDLRLGVLGPEGLGRGGAADGHKAGGLTLQSRGHQLTAGCNTAETEQEITHGGNVNKEDGW